MSLLTVDQFKDRVGITDSTYDDFIDIQLKVVSEAIQGYCERVFKLTSYVQTFYKDEMPVGASAALQLYHFPVPTVTQVLSKASESDVGQAVTDYRLNKPTGTLTRPKGVYFFNDRIIEVSYQAGFSSVPEPVLDVLVSVVNQRLNKKKLGIDLNFGSDVQRVSIPGAISIDYDYSLQTNERKTAFGSILGNTVNVLDFYRSERALIGNLRLEYVS